MLILHPDLESQMRAHGAEGYPLEVVGVIAGRWERDGCMRAVRLFRGSNQFQLAEREDELRDALEVEGSAVNRYFMAAEEIRAIDAGCHAEGIDMLGFYHTHPDHPAAPSPTDLRFAQQTIPGYIYAILSVERGVPSRLTCWTLSPDETSFVELPIAPHR